MGGQISSQNSTGNWRWGLIKGYVDFYPFLSACVSSLFSFALLAFRPDYAFIFFSIFFIFSPLQSFVLVPLEQHVILPPLSTILLVMGNLIDSLDWYHLDFFSLPVCLYFWVENTRCTIHLSFVFNYDMMFCHWFKMWMKTNRKASERLRWKWKKYK